MRATTLTLRSRLLLACVAATLIAVFTVRAFATDQAKTIRTFIGDSDTQISGPVDKPFSLYIGDNLSGVTDPIKSAYVAASGIYTGGGTLEFRMNGSAPSSRVFTLPNVSAPTPFEILYKDPASTVNPATAGTYSYTLNVIPSGITVSAFGAEVRVTYRYKPACVGGYPATGAVTSVVFDTGVAEGAAYNSILWKGTLGGPGQDTGRVRFQFATSNATSTSDPSWVFYGASGGSCTTNTWFDASVSDTPVELLCPGVSFSNKRYFRYRVQICSANNCTDPGAATPVVTSVVVSWSP